MIYKDLIPQCTDNTTLDMSIDFARELTKTNNKPYTYKDTVEGENKLVIFSPHFVEMYREAMANECIAKMSKQEKWLYWDFNTYMNVLLSTPVPDYESMLSDEIKEAEEALYWQTVANSYSTASEYGIPLEVVQAMAKYAANEVWDTDMSACYTTTHTWKD